MGRGKVVMERIEKEMNRQVSFSKRRNSLIKKAYELAVLCDVEVGLIIFSSCGNLSHYASTHQMTQIVEHYHQYCYSSQHCNALGRHNHNQSMYQQLWRLKAKCESLERRQRHLVGEDIESLGVKELQCLEKQLDGALSSARLTKVMIEQLEEVRKKAQELGKENEELKSKLNAKVG